jgi:hypothetical protein
MEMDSPNEEDIQFLNDIDAGIVGAEQPRVNKVEDDGLTVPYFHPEAEQGDDDAGSSFEAYA